MPIFEYRCRKCSFTFEKYSTGGTAARAEGPECPRCEAGDTEKVFSLFASQTGGAPSSTAGGCGSGGFS